MEIVRRIHVEGSYAFDLVLKSFTVEGHSLMTDNASKLDEILRTIGINGDYNLRDELVEMVAVHKDSKR